MKYRSFLQKSALGAMLFISGAALAQDGEAGITAASDAISGYFDSVSILIMSIGAVVGLIGAIRVYIAWNSGERDVNRMLMGWFGSCLFLVITGLVLRGFFGL